MGVFRKLGFCNSLINFTSNFIYLFHQTAFVLKRPQHSSCTHSPPKFLMSTWTACAHGETQRRPSSGERGRDGVCVEKSDACCVSWRVVAVSIPAMTRPNPLCVFDTGSSYLWRKKHCHTMYSPAFLRFVSVVVALLFWQKKCIVVLCTTVPLWASSSLWEHCLCERQNSPSYYERLYFSELVIFEVTLYFWQQHLCVRKVNRLILLWSGPFVVMVTSYEVLGDVLYRYQILSPSVHLNQSILYKLIPIFCQ